MKTRLNGALAALAVAGMICQPALAAQPASAPAVPNVKLTDAGALKGRAVDAAGKPMAGQTVELRKAGAVAAKVATGAQGAFVMPKVAPGTYVLAIGPKAAEIRVWEPGVAPAKSLNEALVMAGDPTVRGQQYCPEDCPPGGGGFFGGLDCITLVTVGSAVTAAVLAGVAVSEINDTNDAVSQLQDDVDGLSPATP